MRQRQLISGWVASKTTGDFSKVTQRSHGRVQDPHTSNIPRSHLNHCIFSILYTDIQMRTVQKTFYISLRDVFLTYSFRIFRNFYHLKKQLSVPSCLAEVWDHPVAQGNTLLTTVVTRGRAQSGLGFCCWGRHCTKLEELFSQLFILKQTHVPRCLNLSLSRFPGSDSFPLHYPVIVQLKVQSGCGVALKHKR